VSSPGLAFPVAMQQQQSALKQSRGEPGRLSSGFVESTGVERDRRTGVPRVRRRSLVKVDDQGDVAETIVGRAQCERRLAPRARGRPATPITR
jgi:hypothetical protein